MSTTGRLTTSHSPETGLRQTRSSPKVPMTVARLTPPPARTARGAPVWRRPRLLRTALLLELPVLAVIGAGLALFGAIAVTDGVHPRLQTLYNLVDPNREQNLSSWLNAALWLVAGVVAGCAALLARSRRISWWTFAVACTYFSVDETVSLHEQLNAPLAATAGGSPFLHYAWVLPGAAATVLVVLLLLRLVLSLPTASRNGLLVGGALFVVGAIGFELLESLTTAVQAGHVVTIVLTTVEETLEMTGVVLCVASVLHLFEHTADGGTAAVRLSAMGPALPRRRLRASGRPATPRR